MRVTDVMTGDVVAITPDASVGVALRLMARSVVRHLPVISGARCVGVAHESDLLWHAWAHGTDTTPVARLARAVGPVVHPLTELPKAAAAMVAGAADVVLVADGGRVVGILTAADMVRGFAS